VGYPMASEVEKQFMISVERTGDRVYTLDDVPVMYEFLAEISDICDTHPSMCQPIVKEWNARLKAFFESHTVPKAEEGQDE